MDHKYTPIQNKLPFLHHHHQHKQQLHQHSKIDTLFTSCNRNDSHRTHSKQWQRRKCHRQHHISHQPNEHSSQNYNDNDDDTTSTIQMNFSKKFSFTQHNNHLSRFYMIFVIFIIYLLDKINCDQGTSPFLL